jgi:FkbM family methyltransferase
LNHEPGETLVDRQYGEPYCDNVVVVNVGSFIGDSALFFASKGAKLVVAFKPVPKLFEILNKNIALNGFEKIISTRNEAISDSSGTIVTGYPPKMPRSSGQNSAENATPVSVTPTYLNEVIMNLAWVDILKMDCE